MVVKHSRDFERPIISRQAARLTRYLQKLPNDARFPFLETATECGYSLKSVTSLY